MSRLPLDLYAEVEDAYGGRYRWDHNQAPGSRLRNFSFRTKIGEGFSDATGQLARRIDLDYPDLGLLNSITLVGADGSVAYEGRIEAMPRELSDTHSIGVTLAGWMAHAKDKKFREIYVDRDMTHWAPMSNDRRIAFGSSQAIGDMAVVRGNTGQVVTLIVDGEWLSTSPPVVEAWYDAGPGMEIAYVAHWWERDALVTSTNWLWRFLGADDDASTAEAGSDLQNEPSSSGSGQYTPATPRRYILVQFLLNAASANNQPGLRLGVGFTLLAAYGNHGLTIHPISGQPGGFYASDIITNIVERFCPRLNADGVEATTLPIPHCAFRERTNPYDAFLEVNKYHLWHLGVWENRTLHYRPYDLTDYQWEIRTDDQGTTFSPQGPSTESLFNGIAVSFTDVLTGNANTITPDDYDALSDTSTSNPWNMHGLEHWDEISLSTPTTVEQAVEIGRAALADRNAPKTPGTITVKGYIRDRAGNYQPAWKPRAGDTIAITNFPNDSPRLIVETDYNDEDKTIRIAVDRPFQLLEAYLDRQQNALQARGLA